MGSKHTLTMGREGHHYRLWQWTLAAGGAVARVIPGAPAERAAELALL